MLGHSIEGTRVLDFSHVLAGPVCTMTLADLGADVVKIEPPGGEIGRHIGPPFIRGESVVALSVNRNKRALAIDLKTEAGRRAVRTMARTADVVVENFRPGVMASLGLDFAALRTENERLVYCAISAFGQQGAWSRRPGVDGVIQAASGLMSTLGEPAGDPVKVPTPVADMVTGYLATIAILGALAAARRTGKGAYLDVSLFNACVMLQQVGYASYFATGADPERQGSGAPYAAPNEAFPTADGWMMVVAYHPARWIALCDVLGRPELASDVRYATVGVRVANRDALRATLSTVFRTRTTAAWLPLLTARDILCAAVARYSDVVASEAYRDSGLDVHVDHPVAGLVRMPRFSLGPSTRAEADPRPPPCVGQHSSEVLRDCGFDDAAIARLAEDGVIRDIALPPSHREVESSGRLDAVAGGNLT